MDWRTKKNKLKVVGTKEYEVKPNTIIRGKVEKNILAEEPILDNFIARKGLRVYETYKDKDGNVHPRRGKDGKVIPRNPRLPIVDFLRHNYAKRIAMVFIDEVHAAQGIDTDVGKALRNLAYISKRSVGLTGTLYGGTASSIYSLLFTFNDKVRERFPWPYGFPWDWVNRMGAIREEYTKKREGSGAYAGWTRYSKSSVKEIPGYSAEMFKLIIENTIFASLKDHGEDIVPYEERVEWVEMSEDQTAQFKIASSVITDYNRGRIASGDYSFIGAMYTNLRFWPTAAFRSQKVEHIIKLDKGAKKSTEDNTKPQHVYTIPSVVDGDEVLPKEEKLIEKLTWALSDERKSLVFVEQTSKRDIQDRLEKLIKDHVPGANPFVLRSNSKSSADRIGFVDQKVEEGCNIMICNPALIREGVDMQWASHIVVYEMPTVSRTFAQAVKRPWGLKQKRNVVVEIIPYDDGLYEALGLQIAASKNAAISVIHGHEGDALAQESNDVDLMTDIKSLIRQGRIDQIKVDKRSVSDSFNQSAYTHEDRIKSVWYTDNPREVNRRPNERPTLLPRNSSTPGNS